VIVTALYHFWSSPQAQRVRLALEYKAVPYDNHPLAYHDDETFFDLGVSRQVPILELDDGSLLTDSLQILWRIDELFPGTPALVDGRIDETAWRALVDWRERCDSVLERLYAPVRPAYAGIGDDDAALKAYKAEVQRRFGMSVEELANDRYDGFAQLDRLTRLSALTRHLADNRYYMGHESIADLVLCADLAPLQTLDGVSLPIDLMYYLGRVAERCGTDLESGLLAA
jgi:glutaredoxin 2